ncbi:MAG: hypothetical protein M1812_000146 [Candelaria pacifica]|nr:MAG: hypothetical protein M1812_000146 [Candelaria pacifica]
MSEPAFSVTEIDICYIIFLKKWDEGNPSQIDSTDLDQGCMNHPVVILRIKDDEPHVDLITSFHEGGLWLTHPNSIDWFNYLPTYPSPSHPLNGRPLLLIDDESPPYLSWVEVHKYYTVNIAFPGSFGGFPISKFRLTEVSHDALVEGIRSTHGIYPTQTPIPLMNIPFDPEPGLNAETLPPSPSSGTPSMETLSSEGLTPGSSPTGTPDSTESPSTLLFEPDITPVPAPGQRSLLPPYSGWFEAEPRRVPVRDISEQLEISRNGETTGTLTGQTTIPSLEQTPEESVNVVQEVIELEESLTELSAEHTDRSWWLPPLQNSLGELESDAEMLSPPSGTLSLESFSSIDLTPASSPLGTPQFTNPLSRTTRASGAFSPALASDQRLLNILYQATEAALGRGTPVDLNTESNQTSTAPQTTSGEFIITVQEDTETQDSSSVQSAEHPGRSWWFRALQASPTPELSRSFDRVPATASLLDPSHRDLEANRFSAPESNVEPSGPIRAQGYRQPWYYVEPTRPSVWAQCVTSVASAWQWLRESLRF